MSPHPTDGKISTAGPTPRGAQPGIRRSRLAPEPTHCTAVLNQTDGAGRRRAPENMRGREKGVYFQPFLWASYSHVSLKPFFPFVLVLTVLMGPPWAQLPYSRAEAGHGPPTPPSPHTTSPSIYLSPQWSGSWEPAGVKRSWMSPSKKH